MAVPDRMCLTAGFPCDYSLPIHSYLSPFFFSRNFRHWLSLPHMADFTSTSTSPYTDVFDGGVQRRMGNGVLSRHMREPHLACV